MPKNVQTVRKPNDDLFVMTHDGDIYHDDKVRQEMGLLISDRNRWALPITPAAPLYLFERDEAPVKDRSVFIYRDDPPAPGDSAMVMNRVLPAVVSMSETGTWKPYKTVIKRASEWKYVCAVLSTIAMLFFAWTTMNANAELRAEEIEIDRARAIINEQPSYDGLPTADEIRAFLEAAEEANGKQEAESN